MSELGPESVGRKAPLRVVLLAYEAMNILDLVGPLQAFATANRSADRALYETIVASVDGGAINSSAGLPVLTVPLAELDGMAIDTLMVAGGCTGDVYHAPEALAAWIERRAPSVRRLCSVCTGAFLLAAANQLEGRRATTHWAWQERLKSLHPGIAVDAEQIYIRDGSVWTSAGVTAGIDLTLALIEDDFGHRVAIDSARQLVMFMKRAGGQSQYSVPLAAQAQADRFAELHSWVASHLREDLRVERLAEEAGMAPRSFARTYVEKLGRTPAKMVEAMRLEAACRGLEESRLPLKSIADAVGYGDEQRLRRAFGRHFGISPSEYRERFSSSPRDHDDGPGQPHPLAP
jgi:transcriptional regulator GlxA family with amidase domain